VSLSWYNEFISTVYVPTNLNSERSDKCTDLIIMLKFNLLYDILY